METLERMGNGLSELSQIESAESRDTPDAPRHVMTFRGGGAMGTGTMCGT